MLILTRKPGEAIQIGNDVTVMVMDVRGNQIRLGITAPRNIAVDREEVWERKKLEQQSGR